MTEERYKEIENILNNIQYTRKRMPKTGKWFKLGNKYSSKNTNVNIKCSEMDTYFRKNMLMS